MMEIKSFKELTPKNLILNLFFVLLFPHLIKSGNCARVDGFGCDLKSRQSDKHYSNWQQHSGYKEHQFDTPRFISASTPSDNECGKRFTHLLKKSEAEMYRK